MGSSGAVLGEKYRVLALDQRGHGGSARTGKYTFELMCDDLLHFANAMNLERFTLIGHSMGGTVSYLFSETFPTRIERLIVEDTPPPFQGKPIEVPSKPSDSYRLIGRLCLRFYSNLMNQIPNGGYVLLILSCQLLL